MKPKCIVTMRCEFHNEKGKIVNERARDPRMLRERDIKQWTERCQNDKGKRRGKERFVKGVLCYFARGYLMNVVGREEGEKLEDTF